MKCSICKGEIKTTFLNKAVGTIIRDAKGKKHHVCSACQRTLGSKEKILEKL